MKMGYGKNVVVMTRPRNYVKGPEFGGLAGIYYRKYPQFAKALKNRHKTYNNTKKLIRRLEEENRVFVISPGEDLAMGRACRDPERSRGSTISGGRTPSGSWGIWRCFWIGTSDMAAL